jgi:filamentous hemagglutinin family protein
VFSITSTPGTIINWQSFSIGAGEITRFVQQGSDSAVLNRVLGQDPSRILGALQSNGKVFLINPNGILFGQGARVDVNGLVASTLHFSDADFLAGNKRFGAGTDGRAGALRNEGSIVTPAGGQVLLVAPKVENAGIIRAPGGEVVLAAGHSVQLFDTADPDLHVVVAAPRDHALNLGEVLAQGGRIGVFGALVAQRGVLNADSAVVGANGKIVLKASGATLLAGGSVTSATGAGQGGAIRVLGDGVELAGNARVDASGALGGGTVLVGGDDRGGGSVQRARRVTLAPEAVVRADATQAGDGGKVVLWSDGATAVHGSISARGGRDGSGGLVETSGQVLDVEGIRVSAAGGTNGRNGSWLLDPYDIEVVAGGTASAGEAGSAGNASDSHVTRVAPATLTAAGTDVVLDARHDLTISDALDAAGSVLARAGHDIQVNARVSSSGGDLDFRARNAFALGANGALRGANYIDIQADQVTLNGAIGAIGGSGGLLPYLSLTSFDPERAIVVGSGSADGNALWLDAGRLGALGRGLFEINLGNSRHTGPLTIAAPLAAAATLVLDNSGPIRIGAPIDLGAGPASSLFATVHDGSGGIDVGGPVATNTGSGRIALDAGAGELAIRAPLAAATVTLGAGVGVRESEAGAIEAGAVAVRGGQVVLNGANAIGTLAGSTASDLFQVTNGGSLRIGSVGGLDGIDAVNAALRIEAAGIMGNSGGGGVLRAASLALRSRAGIGSADTPLQTRTGSLSAYNEGAGSNPVNFAINIANQGALVLAGAVQDGAGNGGAISIDNVGSLTVQAYQEPANGTGSVEVRTSSGDITLAAHSPLTILGRVTTTSGNIRLVAGDGGLLTIAAGARVASGSGEVRALAGTVDIAPGTIQVSGKDKLHLPGDTDTGEPVTPGLDYCREHPDNAACRIVGGGSQDPRAAPLARALQGTVQLTDSGMASIVASTRDDGAGGAGSASERAAGPAQAQQTGAKNDKPAKNYCN